MEKERDNWTEVYRINGYGTRAECLKKMKITGGWIYKYEKNYEFRGGQASGTKELLSICFVPDKVDHTNYD